MPFLGAGVSGQARTCGGSPPVDPNVTRLRTDMIQALTEAQRRLSVDDEVMRSELGLTDGQTLDKADFSRLAEVLTWYAGPLAAVTSTRIEDYVHLVPLPAHRAIARLAREGLFDEVITTNYDCCLERAWRNTIPADRRLNDDPTRRKDRKGWHPAVIRTLAEHRQRGSRRECSKGFPVLRVYKINGCAERLRRRLSPAAVVGDVDAAVRACGEIILTEPQLRDFGERRWARDLLRDRARSAHLLFSGFGSDEAQVRFTMLDLLAELSQDGDERQDGAAPWDEGNAPWIQVYGGHLSYPQAQLLRGYRDARQADCSSLPLDTDTINAFLGTDAAALAAEEQPGLTADLFWTRLHQAAWGRLLMRHTDRASAVHAWLAELGVDAQVFLSPLRAWLYPQPPSGTRPPDDDGLADLASRIGNRAELTQDPGLSRSCKPVDQRPACPPLWRWLAAVNGVDITRDHRSPGPLCPAEQDYYLAWRDDPVLIALVLLLAWLALGDPVRVGPSPTSSWTEGLWLPLPPPGDPGAAAGSEHSPRTWLLVRAEDAALPEVSGDRRGVVIVSVPRRNGRGESGAMLGPPSMPPGTALLQRVAVRQEPLTVARLLRALGAPTPSTRTTDAQPDQPAQSTRAADAQPDLTAQSTRKADIQPDLPALLRARFRRILAAERVDLHRSRLVPLRSAP